ncbi:protein-disulfide reductase DsbD family protein [Candidatus Clavichlamydia salmonicola]|uniref:protein-disulfide reductase DsbD family protein n=1 Tax=Candidatus Clavichlamydia salmonicola TaxID=469812 RepID=UPI001891485E|nr:cytochrome c biogenesis protein CcdA [Candidatus Clavichlamydia salmonicola]
MSFNICQSQVNAQDQERCSVTLIAEEEHVRPGKSTWVGLLCKMPEGMHTYWKNPGEVGFPLQVKWNLPRGSVVEEEVWPAPTIFHQSENISFGFEEKLLVLFRIFIPKNLKKQDICSIQANVTWLACNDECVPLEEFAGLQLPIFFDQPHLDEKWSNLFHETREQAPRILSKEQGELLIVQDLEGWSLRFVSTRERSDIKQIAFIPDDAGQIGYSFQDMEVNKKQEFELPLILSKGLSKRSLRDLRGIFLIYDQKANIAESFLIDGTRLSFLENIDADGHDKGSQSLLWLIAGAFLGGLILNVMPCVLPLIGLKVYSLIKSSNSDRKTIFKKGVWFSIGVIGSFWILVLVGFCLKIFGHNVGWGFQLQEPGFVALLVVVLFLFALNCFGVFESGNFLVTKFGNSAGVTKEDDSIVMGSLSKGVLATLLTTPCTGPFLGSVLGFTLTLSLMKQLLIFSVMGFGMAFPYLLFSSFPKILIFLPKNGNWMHVFKEITGFMLLGTVVWLIGIFQMETGAQGVHLLLISLLITGFAGWLFGKWGTPLVKKLTRRIIFIIVCCIMIFAGYLGIQAAKVRDDGQIIQTDIGDSSWESFSLDRIHQLDVEGRPLFIQFTAKWCVSCQFNKKVLYAQETTDLFKKAGIVTMVADWTKKSADISKELSKVGRVGVPTYVLYYGDSSNRKIKILPQRLSAVILKKEISNINE